jgi:integrase
MWSTKRAREDLENRRRCHHQSDRQEKGHPSTAQKMLGHSDIRMTLAIYTRPTEGMQDYATTALKETSSRSGC